MKKAMGFFSQQDGISPTSRYNWITGGYPLNAGHDGRHSNLFGWPREISNILDSRILPPIIEKIWPTKIEEIRRVSTIHSTTTSTAVQECPEGRVKNGFPHIILTYTCCQSCTLRHASATTIWAMFFHLCRSLSFWLAHATPTPSLRHHKNCTDICLQEAYAILRIYYRG